MKNKWKIEIDASQMPITPIYLIPNVLQVIRSGKLVMQFDVNCIRLKTFRRFLSPKNSKRPFTGWDTVSQIHRLQLILLKTITLAK